MEENGRVTVKRVERPDGMTEYSLEYMPPIMISDGKYLKEEHLNLTTYTKPCNDVERRFNQTVELMVEDPLLPGISNPSRRISLSSR